MEIKPFHALRFNQEVVGDPGTCIAPPYDVIDEATQQELYDSNPYNIIRAIKGIKYPDDTEQDNVYTRAADFLHNAISEKALINDPKEALYAYVQDFQIAETAYQRSGIVALGRLQQFGRGVQPHEKTLEGPKADRLNLTRATAAQFGQIFMLYDDPAKTAEQIIQQAVKTRSVLDFTDKENVQHRLYVIDRKDWIETFAGMMESKQAIIADGHHRYETALNYWAETKNPEAEWQMMTFVNMHNEGLIIQPTHRLIVNLPEFSIGDLLEQLTGQFAIQKFTFTNDTEKADAQNLMFDQMKQSESEGKPIFGLYAADGAFYALTLTDPAAMQNQAPQMSEASRKLDVNVLHMLILDKHLNISDEKLARQSHVQYIKDLGNAIEKTVAMIDSGRAQAVFFVNPTRMNQVKAVASAGEKMPQKSTFFYPKIFSGLTIHTLQTESKENRKSKPIKQECSK